MTSFREAILIDGIFKQSSNDHANPNAKMEIAESHPNEKMK
jgi:hypothetical protein